MKSSQHIASRSTPSRCIALGLTLACLALPAWSLEVSGVQVPDKAQVAGQELALNGAGVRTKFIVKVYVAALYLPQKSGDAAAILNSKGMKRVQLTMKRDVASDTLWESFAEAMSKNHSEAELAKLKPQIDQMAKIFKGIPEAKEGDLIQLDLSDSGATVIVKGETRGTVSSPDISRALLKIWLGEKPATEELKNALLGKAGS